MEKEWFKRKVIEEQIFQEVKNDLRINTSAQLRFYLREKKVDKIVDNTDLFAKITNWRIKVYGSSSFDICVNKEDRHKYMINKYDDKKFKKRRYK